MVHGFIKLCLIFQFILVTYGQFFFQPFGGFFNQQPQQPQFQQPQFQQPQQNFFQNFFQQPTQAPVVTTTTTEAPMPDPDKEVGNWQLPDPRSWPFGPDWNDPRNTPEQQLGWGGSGVTSTTTTQAPRRVQKAVQKVAAHH